MEKRSPPPQICCQFAGPRKRDWTTPSLQFLESTKKEKKAFLLGSPGPCLLYTPLASQRFPSKHEGFFLLKKKDAKWFAVKWIPSQNESQGKKHSPDAGKGWTAGSLETREPWFVVLTNLGGINMPTMADLRLWTGCNGELGWEGRLTNGCG